MDVRLYRCMYNLSAPEELEDFVWLDASRGLMRTCHSGGPTPKWDQRMINFFLLDYSLCQYPAFTPRIKKETDRTHGLVSSDERSEDKGLGQHCQEIQRQSLKLERQASLVR